MHAHNCFYHVANRVNILLCFVVDNSLSLHTHDRKKDTLVLDERPRSGLDNTSTTREAKHSFNFAESRKKLCLSLHCNVTNHIFHANDVKLQQFKVKNSEIKP